MTCSKPIQGGHAHAQWPWQRAFPRHLGPDTESPTRQLFVLHAQLQPLVPSHPRIVRLVFTPPLFAAIFTPSTLSLSQQNRRTTVPTAWTRRSPTSCRRTSKAQKTAAPRSTHGTLPLRSGPRRDLGGYCWIRIWTRSGYLRTFLSSPFDLEVPSPFSSFQFYPSLYHRVRHLVPHPCHLRARHVHSVQFSVLGPSTTPCGFVASGTFSPRSSFHLYPSSSPSPVKYLSRIRFVCV